MADLDLQDQAIVISVVYDGPPEAGKTTSVRALARTFGREVYTPEEHDDGRTTYFDWLEHTGGRFEGAPIRCQIASVPGQRRWARRRGHLIDRADVVIFVGDTSAGGWPETVDRLRELRQRLDARPGAPVGVVFQANKRDRGDIVPMATVRARIMDDRIAVVESVAHDGMGVREAFVFGVRLALDRVREEQRGGRLSSARRALTGGTELLEILRAVDPSAPPAVEAASDGPSAPRLPAADAPSGSVWPPVEGRILLREALASAPRVRVTTGGDCVAGLGDSWRFHSAAAAVYGDIDRGRAALVAWARQHASAQSILSRRRCIVLAENGDGRWRLWQIVQREPSLRELGLVGAARLLPEASSACEALALRLNCTLDTVGVNELEMPIFVGLVPSPEASPEGP